MIMALVEGQNVCNKYLNK